MSDNQQLYKRLHEALQPENFSPAEKEVYRNYIMFLFDYCKSELKELLKTHNQNTVFSKPETVYEAFVQSNGGKGFRELVKEIEGGASK